MYNTFIAGLTFSSFASIVGMLYNPAKAVSVGGAFYVLGVLVYAVVSVEAVRSFLLEKEKFNKLRVLAKTSLMAAMFVSPVPLFAAMALGDVVLLVCEYRLKVK